MINIKNHKQKDLFDPWRFLSPKRRELVEQYPLLSCADIEHLPARFLSRRDVAK